MCDWLNLKGLGLCACVIWRAHTRTSHTCYIHTQGRCTSVRILCIYLFEMLTLFMRNYVLRIRANFYSFSGMVTIFAQLMLIIISVHHKHSLHEFGYQSNVVKRYETKLKMNRLAVQIFHTNCFSTHVDIRRHVPSMTFAE